MTLAMADPCSLLVALGTSPEGAPPLWVQFLPFALILAIFYFVILLPMRRRQKKIADFQASLKVGDRVITTSGIYGTIVKLNERSVSLQVHDKVRLEIARSAIAGYQGQDPVVPDAGGA